jgi:hypothetical protein
MRLASTLGVPAMVLALASAACMGDDEERKRAEAAEWCDVTLRLDDYLNGTDGTRTYTDQITYDQADEWIESAPEDIRGPTRQAALILRSLAIKPRPPALAEARKAIGFYAAEHCRAPARCLADVDGNPHLPCARRIEARGR